MRFSKSFSSTFAPFELADVVKRRDPRRRARRVRAAAGIGGREPGRIGARNMSEITSSANVIRALHTEMARVERWKNS